LIYLRAKEYMKMRIALSFDCSIML